jgi:hypothetical protein
MSSQPNLSDPRAEPELRSYRSARRWVFGLLAALWLVVAVIIVTLHAVGPDALGVAMGLGSTASSVFFLRQLDAAHLHRASAER